MGNSLFGKLKGMMSRQKTSDIATQTPETANSVNLSRIGMAVNAPDQSANPTSTIPVSAPEIPVNAPSSTEEVANAGIQFFAEVPLQQCAEEMISVSQKARNCLSASSQPVGDGIWSVAITLSMSPIPQEIHNVEMVLQAWAEKFGGSSKGWGLSQSQAA